MRVAGEKSILVRKPLKPVSCHFSVPVLSCLPCLFLFKPVLSKTRCEGSCCHELLGNCFCQVINNHLLALVDDRIEVLRLNIRNSLWRVCVPFRPLNGLKVCGMYVRWVMIRPDTMATNINENGTSHLRKAAYKISNNFSMRCYEI